MPNTLGGYGIIDAYTKSEINHIINSIPPPNGGNDITILTSDSWANETDSNIYSALRTRKELDNLMELINSSGGSLNHTHLNKPIIDSITQEHLNILSLLSIDEGNLKVGTNLFSIGEISAYGLGSGSGGGGGGGSLVVWGTESNGTIPLTVEGITKTLALKSGLDLKQDKLIEGSGITITGNTISSNVQELSWDNILDKPLTFEPSTHTHTFASLTSKPTTLSGYGITNGALTTTNMIAGNGLSGGGTLASDRTFALGTPSTLTASTSNGLTSTSHTHAITTTSVGAANTIVQTDATGGTKLNNLMVGGNWKIEQTGTELLLKYNNLTAARFLSDGSIVGLGEITAYGATTGGEGVSLLRTGGTMTGNLIMSADIIMNSGKAIKMGNGWTIEQTSSALYIKKNGVVKGTFNA